MRTIDLVVTPAQREQADNLYLQGEHTIGQSELNTVKLINQNKVRPPTDNVEYDFVTLGLGEMPTLRQILNHFASDSDENRSIVLQIVSNNTWKGWHYLEAGKPAAA